jgi:hypothetical protein
VEGCVIDQDYNSRSKPQDAPRCAYSNDLGYFEPSNSDLRAYKINWLIGKLQNVPTRWKKGYFEPGNDELTASNFAGLEELLDEENPDSIVGVPNQLGLNPDLRRLHRVLTRLGSTDPAWER